MRRAVRSTMKRNDRRVNLLYCELRTTRRMYLLLSSQGKYEEAKAMYRWALKTGENVLGPA